MKIAFENEKSKVSFAYNSSDKLEIVMEDGKNIIIFELDENKVYSLIKGLTLISEGD